MACRAVPSVTTSRMAPAINTAGSAATMVRGASWRALLSSITQRPCGMAPPAAMVAATRAILNGVISSGPWPYDAKGMAAFNSAGSPDEMSSRSAVCRSACHPTL